ncbi:hypothetical protein [Roseomonas fluvialis]|uniref:Uncharacterized protein n=1 Tax=Roseomonas fluvialis TaxID=1750527 RepID=A0ABM7Y4V1_9PROT|nr:hypothetical protein [Roseomonas fluvialis]BDG72893.1 hypothetical protein Rmf_28220 [Roseomonas fluvialis]
MSDTTATDHLTFEATVPMPRDALVALVRRRARLWGILPGFGGVAARRTRDGFRLRISDFGPGSSWNVLEAKVDDFGSTCRVHGRVGRDPSLRRSRLWRAVVVGLICTLVLLPFALNAWRRGHWVSGALATLFAASYLHLLYREVFPFGVRRREPADRAFLVAWLEHKIGVPVSVRADGAAG